MLEMVKTLNVQFGGTFEEEIGLLALVFTFKWKGGRAFGT